MATTKAAPKKGAEEKKRTVITPIGVATFVHVFAPFAFDPQPGQEKRDANYSIMLVFNEKKMQADAQWKALRAGVQKALVEKFGEAKLKELIRRNKLSLPWRKAGEYEQYGEPFVDGNVMITLKTKNPPGIVDERSQPIINQMDFYPGCLARASCLPWAFDTKGNQGCTLLLNNVQKAGDGEKLAGARASAEEEFEPLEEGESIGDDLL